MSDDPSLIAHTLYLFLKKIFVYAIFVDKIITFAPYNKKLSPVCIHIRIQAAYKDTKLNENSTYQRLAPWSFALQLRPNRGTDGYACSDGENREQREA